MNKIIIGIVLLLMVIISNLNINLNRNIEITNEDARLLMLEYDNLFILDVRSKEEYDEGHIEGAYLIPHDEINYYLEFLENFKDNPILVYCNNQSKSNFVVNILLENNFNNVYLMYEGLSNWEYDLVINKE